MPNPIATEEDATVYTPITTCGLPATQSPQDRMEPYSRALYFAELGFGVVPMRPPTGKSPKGSQLDDWPNLAMTTVEQVETYWLSFARPGWRNIALTLDGWTVVDVDPRNGGTASLAKLEADYGPLPATRRHATPSGGFHLVYRAHPEQTLKAKALDDSRYPGIDIKTGRGSLIVAPGSVIPHGRYEEIDTREPAVAPPWLSEIQAGAGGRTRRERSRESHGDGTTAVPWSPAVARRLAELRGLPADHPGRGWHWLGQVAGCLAIKHRTDERAYLGELREINGESDDPIEEDILMTTAERIWDADQAKPAPADKPDRSIVSSHDRTDLGNGRRLRDVHGDDMRYAPGLGWLTWDGRRWERNPGQARRFMHNVADEIAAAVENLPNEVRSSLSEWVNRVQSGSGITAALNEASVLLPIETEMAAFDADPYKLLVGNGVVDLRTGELLPNRREYLLTRGTTVDYDPDGECPMWLDFLAWAFQGDVEMIEYVQRMFGMCLIGNNAHQVAFFLYGPGRSGKTTLTRILSRLLGDYATSADLSVFNDPGSGHNEPLARLAGARLVVFSETRQGQRINEAQFKKFTGEDTLTASFKNKSWFEFVPAFTPVMFGNAQPSIAFDSGVKRRMKVVPMRSRIDDREKNPKLVEQLMLNEGAAILAWAVEGARMAAADHFVPDPPQVAEAVKEYERANDHIGEFIEDCLVLTRGLKVRSDDVWKRYRAWVDAGGADFVEKADPKSGKSELTKMLITWSVENGTPVETYRSSNTRMIRHLGLRD